MPPERQTERLERRLERLKSENRSVRERLEASRKENGRLRKELRNRQRLFDAVPAGIVLVQQEKVVDINQRALDDLGYRAEEVIGKHFSMFVHPDLRTLVREHHRRRVAGRAAPDEYEIRLLAKEGRALDVEVRVNRIRFNGRVGFLASLTRAERRRQSERALVESRKAEALQTMALGLTRRLKGDFEEIHDQLRALRRLVEPAGDAVLRPLERMESKAERVAGTIRFLDCLSREGRRRQESRLLDLSRVVQDEAAAAELKRETGQSKAGTNIKTYLRPVSPIQGDPQEIREMVGHIIRNALESMPDGGDLYLTTEESAGFACLFVQDNGTGIPEPLRDRIFDPFTTSKEKEGLGLSLCRAVIKRHGGTIEVTSEQDQGTIVTVRLPLAPPRPARRAGNARERIKNNRVLVMEDEDLLRELLSQLLSGKGLKVETTESGLEGLSQLKKKKFDMIIADVETTDMARLQLVREIKRLAPESSLALVTENALADREQRVLPDLADLVMSKPLEMNQLLDQVLGVLLERSARR